MFIISLNREIINYKSLFCDICFRKWKKGLIIMENTSIGARIKQRRKELGLTQVQIKEATGISSGNMSEIENGSKLPSTPALIALSSTLDCSIDWILKGESPSDNNADVTDSDEELLLLEEFRNLSEKDRSEIIEIIKIKLRK